MLRYNILAFGVFLGSSLMAQVNLVLNPSFEDTVICPNNVGQVNRADHWDTYANSPEYYNACAPSFSLGVSVPHNLGGYQVAATGSAYAGFTSYGGISASPPNLREFVAGDLATALLPGTKYYVSFKVSLAVKSSSNLNLSSNNIGAKFSMASFTVTNPMPITNSAIIYSASIITDTLSWTRISGSFIADSAYTHVILGNFFDDSHTDTLIMDGSNSWKYAYYYLDDVCVSTDSLMCNGSIGIQNYYPIGKTAKMYPNPAQNKAYYEITLGAKENGFVLVFDMLGNQVGVQQLTSGFNKAILDLASLNDGVYTYRVIINGEVRANNKLVISK